MEWCPTFRGDHQGKIQWEKLYPFKIFVEKHSQSTSGVTRNFHRVPLHEYIDVRQCIVMLDDVIQIGMGLSSRWRFCMKDSFKAVDGESRNIGKVIVRFFVALIVDNIRDIFDPFQPR